MKYKCIIVDDEPLARELITSHLSHFENFDLIDCFDNALKAYTFLETNTVDLIFLDIELPDSNGHELLTRIKALEPNCHVVIMSAHSTVENVKRSVEGGASGFMAKPFTPQKIQATINRICNLPQAQSA